MNIDLSEAKKIRINTEMRGLEPRWLQGVSRPTRPILNQRLMQSRDPSQCSVGLPPPPNKNPQKAWWEPNQPGCGMVANHFKRVVQQINPILTEENVLKEILSNFGQIQ